MCKCLLPEWVSRVLRFAPRAIKLFTIHCSLFAISGCGLFWDRRVSVRITGAGFVDVKSGTSRRVSDSFAKSMDDATWDDYRARQFSVDPEHVREVFQNLVNAGLFDRDKMFTSTKYPSHGRFLAVRAAIDNKTYSEVKNLFEEDPELAERLYNVVLEFNRPTLGRQRAVPSRPKPPSEKKQELEAK